MPNDLTVVRPPAPKYKINELVYAKASAKRGYIEPLMIHDVSFDPSHNRYYYSFKRDPHHPFTPEGEPNLLPVRLYETDITTFCDAQDIQIEVLTADYEKAKKLYAEGCPNGVPAYFKQSPITDKFGRIQPPQPRFGYNDMVYLMDTALSVGRLESFRVSDFRFDVSRSEWLYFIAIHPRLERNMTVGDRDDMRHASAMQYYESELGTFCEAQSEVVKFLEASVNRSVTRRNLHCTGTT
jgi:hypothetical protein